MPPPDASPTQRALVLRALGFSVAIALGAVAVWLIVIADTTRSMRLGVLAGIWGALLGAYAMFGARRPPLEPEPDEQPSRSASDVAVPSAQEIAVRSAGEIERIAEAAVRRAFEGRLEEMLRRELSREVGDLRSEIAQLRQDLLDKVGGQLRLERIETTRVIGSDLEALQHEVRQLKQASETGTLHELGIGAAAQRLLVEQSSVLPASRPAVEAAADVEPARPVDETPAAPIRPEPPVAAVVDVEVPAEVVAPPAPAAQQPAATATAAPRPVEQPIAPAGNGVAGNAAGRPRAAAPARAETTGPVRPPSAQEPAAAPPPPPPPPKFPAKPPASDDPFASLPRITPFTEFELDPIETTDRNGADASRGTAASGQHERAQASPVAPAQSPYTGRRRRADEDDDPDAGRHSRHDVTARTVRAGGRRQRADEDETDDADLLSRLLARGTADH